MVILQDCWMRPDEVFPMRIEDIHWDVNRWDVNRIWIPEGKTDKARRFVAMSDRVKEVLRSGAVIGKKDGSSHRLDPSQDT